MGVYNADRATLSVNPDNSNDGSVNIYGLLLDSLSLAAEIVLYRMSVENSVRYNLLSDTRFLLLFFHLR